MNDDVYQWRDNMPLEEKVAVLFERTGTYIRNTNNQLSEIKTMLGSLLALGNSVDRQGDWQTQHSIHHGEDDFAVGRRLAHDDSPVGARIKTNEVKINDLWREVFDPDGKSRVATLIKAHQEAATTKGVYLSIWRVIAWALGIFVAAGGGGILLGRLA